MKRLILTYALFIISFQLIAHVYAAYTESVMAQDNIFRAGSFNLQISTLDSNQDGIADPGGANWQDVAVAPWSTSDAWVPGESISKTIFLRSEGSVDVARLLWSMDKISRSGEDLEPHIILQDAWYDRNGNGQEDTGEDLLADLTSKYDSSGNGELVFSELRQSLTTTPGYDLEPDLQVLPGKVTNSTLGGGSGTGKGLTLVWELSTAIDIAYEGSKLEVDFVFNGHQNN